MLLLHTQVAADDDPVAIRAAALLKRVDHCGMQRVWSYSASQFAF